MPLTESRAQADPCHPACSVMCMLAAWGSRCELLHQRLSQWRHCMSSGPVLTLQVLCIVLASLSSAAVASGPPKIQRWCIQDKAWHGAGQEHAALLATIGHRQPAIGDAGTAGQGLPCNQPCTALRGVLTRPCAGQTPELLTVRLSFACCHSVATDGSLPVFILVLSWQAVTPHCQGLDHKGYIYDCCMAQSGFP